MPSDRGSHVIAEVRQELRKALGTAWDLQTPYRPQARGKMERINYTIKLQLGKMCQETSLTWVQALPVALL